MGPEAIAQLLYRDVVRAGRADAEICAEITGGAASLWSGAGARTCSELVDARARAWYLGFVSLTALYYTTRVVNFGAAVCVRAVARLLVPASVVRAREHEARATALCEG